MKQSTEGFSPKALLATALPALVGLVVLVLGLVFDDADVRGIGLGMLAGAPIAGAGAYYAKPGVVTHDGH